jgi:hypothetical protein
MCQYGTHMTFPTESPRKKPVLAAVRHLLAPLVRWLLRSGVTWAEFAELGKEVFVDVARRDYGIQGRPTNSSRVAMLTGLSRREVTRVRDVLLGERPATAPAEGRFAEVLSGWHLDPEFVGPSEQPKVLPAKGATASLDALLDRYAGDLPHRALIKELVRRNLIERVGRDAYRVLERDYTRAPQDPDIVRQLGVALHDHGATLAHNLDTERSDDARFEAMATTTRLAPRYARAFAELAATRGHELLEEMDAWLASHEIKEPNDAGGIRMGIGLYLIKDTNRRGREK